jgi:O-antigen/teichoic acid export membrane protein
MDNVTKVTFPAYARLQGNHDELKRAIEKTLFFISFLTFPVVAGMAVTAPTLIHFIPRYSKWEAAILPLVLLCFNSALAAISTPLTNTLNAIGKVKINTYLMLMWTVLTWVLTPYLAFKYGYLGVAYATAIIALTSFIPVFIVHRLVGFSLYRALSSPTLAVLVMLPLSIFLSIVLPPSFTSLIVTIVASAIVYFTVALLLSGRQLILDGQRFIHAFHHKQV